MGSGRLGGAGSGEILDESHPRHVRSLHRFDRLMLRIVRTILLRRTILCLEPAVVIEHLDKDAPLLEKRGWS